MPNGTHAQSATLSHADSVLQSVLVRIEADGFYSVRVASRVIGRIQGTEFLLRVDTAFVIDRGTGRAVALADIDSVWVRRDAALGLGIIGGVMGAILGGTLGGLIATDPDSGDMSPVAPILIGGTLGGAIFGAGAWLLGSFIRTWRLEYARPVNSPT